MLLMCKDVPVYQIEDEEVLNAALLPGIMQKLPKASAFRTWMKYRYASGTNTIARKLKGVTFGQGARGRINQMTHALCFSDCYWVKGEEEKLQFAQISPYYASFWYGEGEYEGQAVPTLYVGGALTKEWKRDGRLYKYGQVDIELQCIELCQKCDVPVEKATLVPGGIAVKNITSPQYMLEQADQSGRLDVDEFNESDVLMLFGLAGAQMLIIDAIIGNGDRHAGNFGWLRDSDTGAYVRMAPLYDFDHALDSTRDTDRLLTDAVTCCTPDYADEIVWIAEIAAKADNEVFRARAESVLQMMEDKDGGGH